MYAGLLLSVSAGRHISDAMAGDGIDDDCISISSLSWQRSIISEDIEPARSELSRLQLFFGFDPPAIVDVPVRGRLRDSWDDSCDSLREEVCVEEGDIED